MEDETRDIRHWVFKAWEYLQEPIENLRDIAFQPETYLQLALAVASAVLAWFMSKRCASLFLRWRERHARRFAFSVNLKAQEVFFLLLLSTTLWFSAVLMASGGIDFIILKILASLTTAWLLIRVTSSTITSQFWSRIIAALLWVTAALSILGLLGPVTELLDSVGITAGKVRISPLLIIKGAIIFGVLLWAIGFVSRILERTFNTVAGLTASQRVLFFKLSNITLYGVAIFIGLNMVGLDLTALAVFGGALGLGIGFGLQKIFSNLISGIILLMDKSVKPGDVIAIGDTYGWVKSLGARYVSVLTRDGKEHLIPNENLISEKVENWSYSDTNIRVHLPVGVSYNADMHLVRELLLRAAAESPRVLADHPTAALIKEFGDNSVNFELRCWIADPQGGVSNIKSEIYFRIWDLFKEHEIEIPFPQRDVHIKADDELKELVGLLRLKAREDDISG